MKITIVKYQVYNHIENFDKTLSIEIENKELWKLIWFAIGKSLFNLKDSIDINLKQDYTSIK